MQSNDDGADGLLGANEEDFDGLSIGFRVAAEFWERVRDELTQNRGEAGRGGQKDLSLHCKPVNHEEVVLARSGLLALVTLRPPQAELGFDAFLAERKIGVAFGEGPDAIDVIGHDDDRVNGEGRFGFDDVESLAQ